MLVFYKTDNFHKIVISCTLFIIINYHQLNLIKNQTICLVSTAFGQHFSQFGKFLVIFRVWSTVSRSAVNVNVLASPILNMSLREGKVPKDLRHETLLHRVLDIPIWTSTLHSDDYDYDEM